MKPQNYCFKIFITVKIYKCFKIKSYKRFAKAADMCSDNYIILSKNGI